MAGGAAGGAPKFVSRLEAVVSATTRVIAFMP